MGDEFTLERVSEAEWILPATGTMRVPARIFADAEMIATLRAETGGEWSALRQLRNVAALPGIVGAAIGLPDIHPGYGFPIGGVAAFDHNDGVVVVGGVGFDINCGVRLMRTPLTRSDISDHIDRLADDLYRTVPAGLGSTGKLKLALAEIDRLIVAGAKYVIERGYGLEADLEFIEEQGTMPGADPTAVSTRAKERQFRQVGTLGAGNHYLEVQYVEEVLDPAAASAYELHQDQIVISIHTGSRALGHQIGQDYLKEMEAATRKYGIKVPELELVCAPISSPEGKRYLSAVAAGANCAFANREVIGHLVRESFARVLGIHPEEVVLVYDIGHNNAKFERHTVDGEVRTVLVHRKGSTRAFGPGRDESPAPYRAVGHPTLVGGSMGTASYVMRGTEIGMEKTFGSGVHGAGRAVSRRKAAKRYFGREIEEEMRARGIALRAHSMRGVAEEAPEAYKDVERVIAAANTAGINRVVARLRPLAVIKG